ncbi:MAG: CDGSH iron-sulfur domain-containing protein [Myxococcales bacterium]|nr:CDGSH iron-sulfur domain-containing protein [Myxococcales bacterium]MDP3501153.1 CDGSH iron-sulfur domain-containing protein [Myxococcales bacterium]
MKITALTDGPLLVEGLTSLVDQNGREFALGPAPTIALCRCGASSTRPRCDGTHSKNGFRCPPFEAPKAAPAVAVWEGEGGASKPMK